MNRNPYAAQGVNPKRMNQEEYREELKRLVYEKSMRQNNEFEKIQEREILKLEEQAQLENLAKREMESRSVKRQIAQEHFSVAQDKRSRLAQAKMMEIAEEQERMKKEQQEFEYEKQAEAYQRALKLKANQEYLKQQADFARFIKEKERNDKIGMERNSEEYMSIVSSVRKTPTAGEGKMDYVLKRHQGLDSFNENNAALKQQLEKEKRDRANYEMRLEMQRQSDIKLREKERAREELWREQEMSKQLKIQMEEMDELEKLKKHHEQEALQRAYNAQLQEKLLSENRNLLAQKSERSNDALIYNSHNGQYDPDYDERMMLKPPRANSMRPALSENPSAGSMSRGKARGQYSPLIKAGTSIFS